MLSHHQESIQRVSAYFQQDPEVQALLLGGSLAHGFARPVSDVDVMIIVSDQDYAMRHERRQMHFFNRELCGFPEGYVDGKYIGAGILKQIADRGSEPSRFAFLDSQIIFSHIEGLSEILQAIVRYPVEDKEARIKRFYAQFETWNWYAQEALKHQNKYLLGVSISRLILFGGRLVLAHNEMLYPYHKWMLRVLESAPDKPEGMLSAIQQLLDDPASENIQRFFELVIHFRQWITPGTSWPNQFMIDSEMNWLRGESPIDDI
ncbi:hypothetical protein JXA32_17935 [Candidatus Sumerlaeota bacterium]|nr:hypothetical protein [Candidatus Sumerlaeota bacterium]